MDLYVAFCEGNMEAAEVAVEGLTSAELADYVTDLSVIHHREFVEFVLGFNPDMNARCDNHCPMWFKAVELAPTIEITQLFMNSNLDIDGTDQLLYNGLASLLILAYDNQPWWNLPLYLKKLNLLWREGVDLEKKNVAKQSILSIAKDWTTPAVEKHVAHMCNVEPLFHFNQPQCKFTLPHEFVLLLSTVL